MKTTRTLLPLAFALAVASAAAQVQPPVEEAKPAPQPSKGAAQSPKKPEAKKAQPVKKVVAPKKAAPAVTGSPNVRVYKAGDPNIPTLLDKDGKAIPTSPNAYDVSSARKK